MALGWPAQLGGADGGGRAAAPTRESPTVYAPVVSSWKAPCRAWTSPPLPAEATATSCSPTRSLPCVSTLCESVLPPAGVQCCLPRAYGFIKPVRKHASPKRQSHRCTDTLVSGFARWTCRSHLLNINSSRHSRDIEIAPNCARTVSSRVGVASLPAPPCRHESALIVPAAPAPPCGPAAPRPPGRAPRAAM